MSIDYVFGGKVNADETPYNANNDNFFRLYGDGDGDGDTDFTDFANGFLPAFGSTQSESPASYREDLDFDGDGDVDFTDFAIGFLPKFGTVRP